MHFEKNYPNSRENRIKFKGDPMVIKRISEILSALGGYVFCFYILIKSTVFESIVFFENVPAGILGKYWN